MSRKIRLDVKTVNMSISKLHEIKNFDKVSRIDVNSSGTVSKQIEDILDTFEQIEVAVDSLVSNTITSVKEITAHLQNTDIKQAKTFNSKLEGFKK